MRYSEDAVLPISLVAQTVSCERRAWLEANGEKLIHRRCSTGIRRMLE